MSKKELTLKDACAKYKVPYREGVTRLIDLAKVLKTNYFDGMTIEDIISEYENR